MENRVRHQRLDRQLESNENVTKEIRKLLEYPLSAIGNSTTDLVQVSQWSKTCFKQYIEQVDSAAAACCKNGTFHKMSEIESDKENITKRANFFLALCWNHLQKKTLNTVSDTDGHIFSDLNAVRSVKLGLREQSVLITCMFKLCRSCYFTGNTVSFIGIIHNLYI